MEHIMDKYEELSRKVADFFPNMDKERLFDALQYAYIHHDGQMRKDGTHYITHPIAVASIVAELGLDEDSVITALLHDCIEDTSATFDDIASRFGVSVANLVEAVTKLSKMHYTNKEELQMESLRKMFMAMAKDIRVIFIKICDRLHNMRTMEYQSPAKQREKSLETMQIYAPIAHRLGMQKLKWELEDLSLRYLDPVGYAEIETDMAQRAGMHREFLESTHARIEKRILEDNIHCTIYGRVKHTYSIYRKMFEQNRTIDEIFDLYAVRVIVDDISECYNVLGCVHDMYKPVLGRFKDYIGTPKPNMYQSLHTTVIGRAGIPFEVQIRTWSMHQMAEYGVAAHWKYKLGMTTPDTANMSGEFDWVKKLLESQQDADADEFLNTLKVDMFADEVFVFTPEGDVKSLPAKATPIDFGYSVHSAVGNAMVGAKVNGRMVSFDYELENGDIVEILTSKNAKGPNRDWLQVARSNEARNKIRQWFKKEKRGENIVTGRGLFEAELKYQKIPLQAVTNDDILPHMLQKLRVGTLDELYAAIGYGGTNASKTVARMREELDRVGKQPVAKEQVSTQTLIPNTNVEVTKVSAKSNRTSISGIIVDGMGDCLVKFAKCCTPVPGDPVIGFITRGYGVSVHRRDCPNVKPKSQDAAEASRWIPIEWAEEKPSTYYSLLELSGKDRDNMMLDVATTLSACKVRVRNLTMRGMPDGHCVAQIEVEVADQSQLTTVVNKLNQVQGVYHVGRVTAR